MRKQQSVAASRKTLLAGTALQAAVLVALAAPAGADPAPNARPLGGSVSAGSASITATPSTTTITQTSQRAALNWTSFDVGAKQTVDFVQPSSGSVALNRVVGPNPSQIAGRIDANGQVILINQDGVLFYKGAQVNTAGLVVSAAGMTDRNFMAGRMVFDQPAHPGATVKNAGTLTVSQAGLAALVAPQVVNSGVISAKLGHVVLAGASTATLDLYGDGLINLDVSNQVRQTPSGATALVTNTGTILAEGGTVQLTARAADGVVRRLIADGGTIAAASVGGQTGAIVLDGVGGGITVSGALLAQGLAAGTPGGAIEVLPTGTARLGSSAALDASGAAGGGTIAIGTSLARAVGGPSVIGAPAARNVKIAAGASILADATNSGDGGRVTLLSADSTVMAGSIFVRGGPGGGDGGAVEISGGSLGYSGRLDVGAPLGAAGHVLFDPETLTIIAGPSGDGSADGELKTNHGTIAATFDATTSDSVSVGALKSIGSGTIVLQASTLLEVQSGLTFSTGVAAVTLESLGSLVVDNGQSLVVPGAGASLTLLAGGAGAITMTGGTLTTPAVLSAASISLSGGSGGVALANASINAPGLLDIAATGGGDITQTTGGRLNTGTLSASTTGSIALGSSLNAVATLGSMSAGPSLQFANAGSLAVNGPISATAVALSTAAGDLTLAGNVTGGSVALAASAGNIVQLGSTIIAGTLSAAAFGTLNIGMPGNAIVSVATATAGTGDVVLASATNLAVDGTISGQNVLLQVGTTNGILALGSGGVPATVTATGAAGSIALTSDQLTEVAGSTLTSAGAVIIAPFSPNSVTLGGTSGPQLLIDTTLLAGIDTHTLVVGSATTAQDINVVGPVIVTGHAVTLDLLTGGSIAGGALTVGDLAASADSIALVSASNNIGTLDGIAATSSLQVTNGTALTVAGPIGAASATLRTVSGDLTLTGTITATGVALTASSGSIAQSVGTLSAGTLTASASVSLDLGATANVIGTVDSATADISLQITNHGSLTVAGPVGAGTVVLTTSTGDLLLGGNVTGSSVTLTTDDGSISQSGSAVATSLLTVSAAGSLALVSPSNTLTALGSISAGTSLQIVNHSAMTVDGPVGAQSVMLSTVTGDLTLAGNVTGTAVALTAMSGSIVQTGSVISATTLTGGATGSIDLMSTNNAIGMLGNLAAGPSLLIANGTTLTVAGPVSAAAVTLSTGTGDLALAGYIAGTTMTLSATPGNITQTGGVVSAGTLTGSAAGSLDLGSPLNTIGTLSGLSAGQGLTISNKTSLSVSGSLNASAIVLSTTTGDLTLAGALKAASVSLAAGADVTQSAGTVTAQTLSGSATGGFDLGLPTNSIAALGSITAGTSLRIFSLSSLTVTGTVSAEAVTLSAAGGDLAIDGTLIGTIESLAASAGNIPETGVIDAGTLSATASGSIDLFSVQNRIAQMNGATAGSGLLLASAENLALTGTLSGQSVTVEVAFGMGTLALGGGGVTAELSASPAGGVTLLADRITDIAGDSLVAGTVSIAPFSPNNVSLAGTPGAQLLLDTTLLNAISATTLIVGGTATATGISVDGPANLIGHAATLDLLTKGFVSEFGGPLQVGTLTVSAGTGIALSSALNAIATVAGAAAGGGSLAIADGTNLLATGALSGQSIALRLAAGDTLALGGFPVTAALTANGSITLLADRISETAGSTIVAASATIAPVSAIPITIAGTTAPGLLLDGTLLNEIAAFTLVVGSPGGPAISIGGATNLTGHAATLELLTGGSVAEPLGPLSVATLTATAGGPIVLGATANAIGTLQALSASAITLADGGALTVLGPISAGSRLAIAAAGGLTIAGSASLSAPEIQLDGGSGGIAFAGTGVVGGPATTLDLGGAGGVTEPASGTIEAALIISSSGVGGSVALLGTANEITGLGSFAVTGGDLTLADSGADALTVSGTVTAQDIRLGIAGGLPSMLFADGIVVATQTLALTALSGIFVGAPASLDGQSVALSAAGPITLTGGSVIGDPLATVALTSSGAGVAQDPLGVIIAATLESTGGIAGAADLAGTANAIATLENFLSASLQLADGGATNLTIAGKIAIFGNVVIGGSAPPAGISLVGTLTGSAITLEAGSGGILSSGSLNASGIAELDTTGGVQQSGGFVAAALQSTGVTGPVTFSNTDVATLGGFPVGAGSLALDNAVNLVVGGPVTAENVAIAAGGPISVAGSLAATGQVALTSTAGIAVAGPVTAGGIAIAASGAISISGTLAAAGQLALTSTGSISEPGGIIAASMLTAGGAGSVVLGNPANQIGTLGPVGVFGGTFDLADGAALLTVAGPVNAGNVTLGTPTALTLAGNIAAIGQVSLAAGSGGIATGTPTQPASLVAGSLVLTSAGTIGEPNGTVTAARLTLASAGTANLDNAGNAIAALGSVSVGDGDFVLADGAAPLLTVVGPVTAANVTLDPPATLVVDGTIAAPGTVALTAGAGGIVLAGVLDAGSLILSSGGAIAEPGGSIAAATLSGGSAGATDLDGSNAIGQILSFTAGTEFTLTDSTALALIGTLSAPLIEIDAPNSLFTLGAGAAIVTGGTAQPADFVLLDSTAGGANVIADELPTAPRPAEAGGQPLGAYFTVGGFAQLGSSRIAATSAGGASILRIDAAGTGDIIFAGLQGPGTWLLIDVAAGKVTGNIFVKSLTLQYPAGYAGATLAGTINDVLGQAAAGEATILPLPSSKFSLNQCPIHSVNCILLPLETVPLENPLENFSIGTLLNNNDDENLLLPIVSNRDY